LEHGFNPKAAAVEELVVGYSYYEQWAAELARRAADAGISRSNTLVFIDKEQIDRPRSVEGDGYSLHYMGTIRYRL
jgi:hypothetical protein